MTSELSDSFNENIRRPRFSYNYETVSLVQQRSDSTVNAPNIIASSAFAIIVELSISFMLSQMHSLFDFPVFQSFHLFYSITCFVINGVASNVYDRKLLHQSASFVFFALCCCITALSTYGIFAIFRPYDDALYYYGIAMTLLCIILLSIGQSLTSVAFYCYLLKCVPATQCYGKYLSIFISIVQFSEVADEWLYYFNGMVVSMVVMYVFLLVMLLLFFFTNRLIKIPAFDQIDVQLSHFRGQLLAKDDVLYFVRDLIKTQQQYYEETEESRAQPRQAQVQKPESRFQRFLNQSPQLKSYIKIFFGSLTGLNFILQSFVTVYVTEFTLQFRYIAVLSYTQNQEINTDFAVPEAYFYRIFVLVFELIMIPLVFALGFYFDFLKQRFGSKLRARFVIQFDAFLVTLLALCSYSTISFNSSFNRVLIIILSVLASAFQYTSLFIYLAAEFPRAKRIAICVVSGVYNLVYMVFGVYAVASAVSNVWMQLAAMVVNAINVGITACLLLKE